MALQIHVEVGDEDASSVRESAPFVSASGKPRGVRIARLQRRVAQRRQQGLKRFVYIGIGIFLAVLAVLIAMYVIQMVGISLSHQRVAEQGNFQTSVGRLHGCQGAAEKVASLKQLVEQEAKLHHFYKASQLDSEAALLVKHCSHFEQFDDSLADGGGSTAVDATAQ